MGTTEVSLISLKHFVQSSLNKFSNDTKTKTKPQTQKGLIQTTHLGKFRGTFRTYINASELFTAYKSVI